MAHVIDFKEAGFESVLDELEWRGLISQSTDRNRLAEALNGDPISYYCGFDPTAASLHIGNLCSSSTCVTFRRGHIRLPWSAAPPA